MLAAGFTRIGAADVLEVLELPEPRPGPGEVLIRVAAIASFIPDGLGAHAQFVVVSDDSAAEIPAGLDMVAAATIPMSGLTAQLALDRAMAGGARNIAVTGAGGAVGAFAIELARAAGLETFAVVRPAYAERARALLTFADS